MKPQTAPEKFATFRAKHKLLAETIAANKQAMTDMGKITEGIYKPAGSERQLVNDLLDHLNFNDYDRGEVMQACAENPDSRKYWVARAKESLI